MTVCTHSRLGIRSVPGSSYKVYIYCRDCEKKREVKIMNVLTTTGWRSYEEIKHLFRFGEKI